MERHLYKAKTTKKDNPKNIFDNVWVEGDLIISAGKYYIHPRGNAVGVEGEIGKMIIMHEVDPDTICQCTRSCDKNGKLIWEGDIVKFNRCTAYPIVYDTLYKCLGSCWYSDFDPMYKYRHVEMEVIGNRFDNPELVEVQG